MVEEYEEIADSQYQSERQELYDEDYGKQIFLCIFSDSDCPCAGLCGGLSLPTYDERFDC